MSQHNINVFISHSWTYSEHYDTLADWIFETPWTSGQASLNFRNYSVPKDDPIHNARSDVALQDAIFAKIIRSHVIVIPTGMYSNYSKWIQKELRGADQHNKPILAVNPLGQQRKSAVVQKYASETKGWNRDQIVASIWSLYRQ